ncbi:MAG: PAS domain S-box protein [Chitinivibrionales bacterium]|nr:PAS domain S-box protein [Chitinivibrionales bacterium]
MSRELNSGESGANQGANYRNLLENMQFEAEIIKAIPSGLFIYQYLDPGKLILLHANPEAEKLTGISLDTSIGMEFNEIWPAAEAEGITRKFLDAFETGKIYETEELSYQDQRLSGAFRLRVFKISQSRLAVAFENVTDRKQAQDRLRISEERFRYTVEATNDGLWDWDLQNDSIYWSPRSFAMLGYEPGEFSINFDTWKNLVHPDDLAEFEPVVMAALEKAKPFRFEFRYRTKSGGWLWVLGRGKCVQRDAHGNSLRMVGTHIDLTEHRQTEEALRESKEKFEAFYKNAPIAYQSLDENGLLLDANPAWLDTLGYERSEVIGKPFESFLHTDDVPRFEEEFLQFKKRGIACDIQVRLKHHDGHYIDVSYEGRISFAADGSFKQTYCVFQDITGRKEAQLALRESEERLRQSEKMEAIGHLAGGIAHDFNNILGGIIGYADLALDEAKHDSRLNRYLNKILTAGERAKELVNQILSFSRRGPETSMPIYVRPIVKEAVQLLRATLPTSIQIHRNLQKDTLPILADPIKIHEIVMNLCTNAAHAMNDKGELRVACEEKYIAQDLRGHVGISKPGYYCVISVGDTGCGMSEEVLSHVFEPFYTTKEVGRGTGMGLAVVFGIVQGYEGNILVESSPGAGTLFSIFLPKTTKSVREYHLAEADIPGGKERILFIDDEEMLNTLVEEMLTGLGYTVTVFNDSQNALQAFRKSPQSCDLVITDQTMPGLTGIELSQQLLALRPELPIILCTGYSKFVDEDIAREAGIRRFIMKPLRKKELARKIREALTGMRPGV